MLGILANAVKPAFAAHKLTLITNLFYGCSDFHMIIVILPSIDYPALDVSRSNLHGHLIPDHYFDIMQPHFAS